MRSSFPLYNNHLDLAHFWWERLLKISDHAIDATCGNGHDTLFIAKKILTPCLGKLTSMDIQPRAIEKTRELLKANLDAGICERVDLILSSHHSFPPEIEDGSIALAVYNLGWLPGGDKSITTCVKTTLGSLERVMPLIKNGGAVSITCYPGHPEGAKEQESILEWSRSLCRFEWNVCLHQWLNAAASPVLLIIQKRLISEDL